MSAATANELMPNLPSESTKAESAPKSPQSLESQLLSIPETILLHPLAEGAKAVVSIAKQVWNSIWPF